MQVNVHVQSDFDNGATQTIAPVQEGGLKQAPLVTDITFTDIPWQTWFQKWFEHLQPSFSPIQAYELSLLLTNNAGIQDLNGTYRHLDRPTDVLAFATLDNDQPSVLWTEMPLELGDIIISVETAARQAQDQQHALITELAWLATHGLLHLLGWDHPTPDQLQRMLTQQESLIEQINLPS